MAFRRVLVWKATQTASFMIGTRIAVSISFDDNLYAKRAF